MFSLLDFCFCPKTSGLWSSSPTAEEESIDAPSLMQTDAAAQGSSSLAELPREPSVLTYEMDGP